MSGEKVTIQARFIQVIDLRREPGELNGWPMLLTSTGSPEQFSGEKARCRIKSITYKAGTDA